MDFFNYVGQQFSNLGETIINALPSSPIVWLEANTQIKQYLKWVNWFIPIYQMIPVLEAWIACVICYYVIQLILRWVKFIE